MNWLFLLGSLGASVPVVIHLIYRRKSQVVYWPSLRFLRTSVKRTSYRKRLQELLLLAMRAALLALVSMALARPFLKILSGSVGAETAAAVVLDCSFSMSCLHNDVPRFERAKKEALKLLGRGLPDGSACAVIFSGVETPEKLLHLTRDIQARADAIAAAEVSYGRADLASDIQRGLDVLAESPFANRELYVLSDLQRSSLEFPPGGFRLKGAKPAIVVLDVSQPDYVNVAVTSVEVRTRCPVVGMPVTIEARVANFSAGRVERELGLYLAGEKVDSQPVELEADATGTVSFSRTFESPGAHTGCVRIGGDSVGADNSRYFVIEVQDKVPVLLVGKAFYLRKALDPFRGPGGVSRLRPDECAPAELSRLALASYSVVFLAEVGSLGAIEAARLKAFVASGGGLVVFPPSNGKAEGLRAALGELLPVEIAPPEGSEKDREKFWTVRSTGVDFTHPVLVPLKGVRESFEVIRAYKSYRMGLIHGSFGRALVRLEGLGVFLAWREYGEGHVFVFSVPPELQWSNLPARSVFLPLVHEMAYYVSARKRRMNELVVGARIPLSFPARKGKLRVRLTDPRGSTEELESSGEGENSCPPRRARFPGVYEVRVLTPPEETRRLACNVDSEESDLQTIGERSLKSALEPAARKVFVARDGGEMTSALAQVRKGMQLWKAILWSALALILFECFFSNRAMPGGRVEGPRN